MVYNCVYLDVISEDDDSAGEPWVACDLCDTWYHVMCTSIPPEDHNRLADVHWACEKLLTSVILLLSGFRLLCLKTAS